MADRRQQTERLTGDNSLGERLTGESATAIRARGRLRELVNREQVVDLVVLWWAAVRTEVVRR